MDAQTYFTHAVRHHQNGNILKAIDLYRQSLMKKADNGTASLYLALALQQTGALTEAESAYRQALHFMPDDIDTLNGLGTVYLALGKIGDAHKAHLAALEMNPVSAEALSGLGNVFLSRGQSDEAITHFTMALAINPESPDTLSNLGVALKRANRPIEAIARFEEALKLNSDGIDTLYNLGNAWQARGNMKEARRCFLRAQRHDPWAVAPRWGACFAHLEMTYETEKDIASARKNYEHALDELDQFLTLGTPAQLREVATVVGANQPFFLTYQGKNDRELQSRYGAMMHRVMTTLYPQFANPTFVRTTREKIRVGFATGYMHEHSVWKIPTRGWAKFLNRQRFEVIGYYTGVKYDHCTDDAYQFFDKLIHEPSHFESLCQAIIDARLDVLIYPDIGMDPTCAKLAALRLAPVQCVSLGHPMTTGLPTMDYFLSSELMEPDDGNAAYTERLIKLPNLSVHYEPLRHGPPRFDRRHFGLPDEDVIYFCPQTLYKYLPTYDTLFPSIAKHVPRSRFVFLLNATADCLNEQFTTRLTRAFSRHDMRMEEHVSMLPYQGPNEYHALNCISDIFLDSIEWSGFNTAMEAANTGLPIITYPKGLMRGRHTHAVATRLGCTEAIANSMEEYVDLAIRLGNDHASRNRLRARVERNRSTLFGDMEAVHGLEFFLESCCR